MSYKSITEEQYSKITLAYNKLSNEHFITKVRDLDLDTESMNLKNMFDELKEDLIVSVNGGDFDNQEGLEEWVYWNTNSDSVDYQHYQNYITSMSSREIRFVIAEIQQHFKEECDMSVFETYSDEEITKYAVCYCGIFISKLEFDEQL
jgi:hypothetical protein